MASLGPCRWTGWPFQTIWPALGSQIPEMVLIRVDLPAPLSPTSAVTCPAGMSKLMSDSACTGPKLFPMPRRLSRGADGSGPGPDGARPAAAGRALSPALAVTTEGVQL